MKRIKTSNSKIPTTTIVEETSEYFPETIDILNQLQSDKKIITVTEETENDSENDLLDENLDANSNKDQNEMETNDVNLVEYFSFREDQLENLDYNTKKTNNIIRLKDLNNLKLVLSCNKIT